jgi:hypothetical protein
VFEAHSADARCPKCKSTRTRWIPGGVAIGGRSKNVESVARSLAADYGMSDFHSPERGKAARRLATPARTHSIEPVPGWKINVPYNSEGNLQAACAPTGQTVKIKPSEGTVGRTKMGMPPTKIVDRYNPRP